VLVEAIAEDPLPTPRVSIASGPRGVAALRCSQCDEPLCVFSCKSGALYRLADGGVEFDESRCVACLMCFAVCPFITTTGSREKVRSPESGVRSRGQSSPEPQPTPGAWSLEPGAGVRSDRPLRCDVCAERETPACVAACPTKALGTARRELRARTGARPTAFTGRLVVVGSSAAGIAACEAARELAPDCSITMITADARHYSRPLLPYVLAGRIGRDALAWRAHDYLDTLRVDVIDQRRAARLSPEQKTVWLDDGRKVPFDALVVATGARATSLDVPGWDLPGVYPLRDLADLEDLDLLASSSARLKPAGPGLKPAGPGLKPAGPGLKPGAYGTRAVVVGGGNVGLQVCEALARRGVDVTVVVRSSHLLSQMLDEEAGRRAGALFARHGVALRTGRDVVEIAGDGRVERVRLDDGECIEADLVVVGKGIHPNVEWLQSSGIRIGRGVVVDRSGRTNLAGVFAAGDCAETDDPITGQATVSGIWPVAYEMGRTAGSAAVGGDRQSPGALRMNCVRFFDAAIISIGDARTGRVAGATEHVLTARDDVYRKLVMKDDRVIGAILYGDVAGAGLYYRLYRDGVELGGLRAEDLDRRRAEMTAALAEPRS
jgi:NAD(P)H-nitrite reductase large subunit/Fe-S-cluster-containing hydrogenase component 2